MFGRSVILETERTVVFRPLPAFALNFGRVVESFYLRSEAGSAVSCEEYVRSFVHDPASERDWMTNGHVRHASHLAGRPVGDPCVEFQPAHPIEHRSKSG